MAALVLIFILGLAYTLLRSMASEFGVNRELERLMLTETAIDDAWTLVERVREAVAQLEIAELPQRITISAGLTQ